MASSLLESFRSATLFANCLSGFRMFNKLCKMLSRSFLSDSSFGFRSAISVRMHWKNAIDFKPQFFNEQAAVCCSAGFK